MRPVIIGRDFIYRNDIKVSYYRNGKTKLEMQEEELVAAMDMVPNSSLKLKTQTGSHSSEEDMPLPKIRRPVNKETTIPKASQGNSPRFQARPPFPVSHSDSSPGGSRSLSHGTL